MNHYSDNETISLLHFRLRSARHKKRAQHEDREKKLLALHWEENDLHHQQRSLGWVELNPPVMRGYKRYFVLRNDIAKSKQANFFEGLLEKINTTQYNYRKDFKIKRRKGGKKVYKATKQTLLQFEESYFKRQIFSEKEKSFFEERWMQYKESGKPYKAFVIAEPWRFVLRVRPNIITKARVRDEVIESRIQQLRNYFQRNALRGKLNHLTDGHSYSWREGEKAKEKNPFRNKPLAKILDEYYRIEEEKII